MAVTSSPAARDARAIEFLSSPRKMLINGEWVDSASGKTFATYNPADNQCWEWRDSQAGGYILKAAHSWHVDTSVAAIAVATKDNVEDLGVIIAFGRHQR